jgi:hypothetical protein
MQSKDLAERYRFLQHGDHACAFYRDDSDLLQMLGPFLLQGLRGNERCFAAQRDEFIPALVAYLEANDIDVTAARASGQLEIQPAESVYFPDGVFDRVNMCGNVRREIDKTIEAGFAGLRMAGDLVWLDDPRTVKEILDYEYLVNRVTEGFPIQCICQYPATSVGLALHDALMQHHNVRIRRLPDNTHYGFALCNGQRIAELVGDGASGKIDLTIRKIGAQEATVRRSEPNFKDALALARRSLLAPTGSD